MEACRAWQRKPQANVLSKGHGKSNIGVLGALELVAAYEEDVTFIAINLRYVCTWPTVMHAAWRSNSGKHILFQIPLFISKHMLKVRGLLEPSWLFRPNTARQITPVRDQS